MMMMKTQICLTCHQKNDTYQTNKLRMILRSFKGRGLTSDHKQYGLMWGSGSHCRYGMLCPTLEQASNEAKRIEVEIEGYFNSLFMSDNISLYHQTLELLRGDFPDVYNFVEREWHTARKGAAYGGI